MNVQNTLTRYIIRHSGITHPHNHDRFNLDRSYGIVTIRFFRRKSLLFCRWNIHFVLWQCVDKPNIAYWLSLMVLHIQSLREFPTFAIHSHSHYSYKLCSTWSCAVPPKCSIFHFWIWFEVFVPFNIEWINQKMSTIIFFVPRWIFFVWIIIVHKFSQ